MPTQVQGIHAIIQAGGLGHRIRAAAGARPKPLLQVGGRSMLDRLVSQLLACGITRIGVVVNEASTMLGEHLERLAATLPKSVELSTVREREPLGNAGALGVIDSRGRPVLLAFADLVTSIEFTKLIEAHRARGDDATLASHYEDHQLTLGELVCEGDAVRRYVEKPRKRFLICSGIAVFEPRVIAVARTLPRPFGLVDLVNASLASGARVTHWLHESYWIDVNTPELLEQARRDFLQRERQAM